MGQEGQEGQESHETNYILKKINKKYLYKKKVMKKKASFVSL